MSLMLTLLLVMSSDQLPPPPKEPEMITDEPVAMDDGGFIKNLRTLDELKRSGAQGDPKAAFKVYRHYLSGSGRSTQLEDHWLLIAAENGNQIAQYNFWFNNSKSADQLSRDRAQFWLCRSAKEGFSDAVKQVEKDAIKCDIK